MIEKDIFLKQFNISTEAFDKTTLSWELLLDIYNDFSKFRLELEEPSIYLFNTLMKCPKVHSVRYRIKDSEHLIEKIIRKKIENPESDITIDNYKETVTDLIGLRALHLYKDDWEGVHDFIVDKWNCNKPIANYRDGDAEVLLNSFKEKGCETKKHKYGYRSVHYIIETQPAKVKFYAEIQVRTIFEEAWSEIDHNIRYPYDLDNELFFQFLLILNRLAGSADEMGSFIKFLQQSLKQREIEFQKQIDEKSSIIDNLEKKLAKTSLQGKELKDLISEIEKLKSQKIEKSIFGMSTTGLTGIAGLSTTKFLNDYNKMYGTTGVFKDLGTIGSPKDFDQLSKMITTARIMPKDDSKK